MNVELITIYFKKIFKSRLIRIVFFAMIFLLVWFLGLYIYKQINIPVGSEFEQKHFVIKKGESLNQISNNLKKAGLIRNAFLFKFYVLGKGWAKKMKAGEYELTPYFNMVQIAEKIKNGETISNEVLITIPEGFTVEQIANRLEKNGIVNAEDFLNYQLPIGNYEFLPSEDSKLEVLKLEGYLFPDTYRFKKSSSAEKVAGKMLNNFNKKVTSELRKEIERQGKTINEIIIMASLLEKEVVSYDDKRIVSGIFWRRLENNYPLESCATIAYILKVDKWRYSYKDTRINSPYNTYIHTGLPPSPICNPGIESIKAAIYPKRTEYNYFLTDPKTKETIFSKTLEEHNMNKRKYFGKF